MILFFDVIKKILSRGLNYVVDVIICPRFGNSSISIREGLVLFEVQ